VIDKKKCVLGLGTQRVEDGLRTFWQQEDKKFKKESGM